MRIDWIFLPRENPCAKFYIIIIVIIISIIIIIIIIIRTIIIIIIIIFVKINKYCKITKNRKRKK